MKKKYFLVECIAVAVALLAYSSAVTADAIVDWNSITVKATKIAGQNSNYATRTEAIAAIAVYDAVNA